MFKTLDPDRDIQQQLNSINEVLVFGGAIFSGSTIGTVASANIKKYNHWSSASATGSYYHGLYSDNVTASTAIELIDVTFGFSISSSYYADAAVTNRTEKNKMYRLHAKNLLGGENERFNIGGANRDNLIFVDIRRSQFKDEIKKETVSLRAIFSGSSNNPPSVLNEQIFTDVGSSTRYVKGIRGDYALLVSGTLTGGVVYYQAGVLVLIPENISSTSSTVGNAWSGSLPYQSMVVSGGGLTFDNTLDAVRSRIRNLTIVNQSNLHSTYYFCRLLNDEFNYSSNPTFIDSTNRILPTSGSNNLITRTYITRVGLLGQNQELLAVASLSKPVKKDPSTEFVIRVRLDS